MTQIERSILSAITFFDIFNYPLTFFEVWKWLYKSEILNLKSQIYNLNLKSDVQRHPERSPELVEGRSRGISYFGNSEGVTISKIQEILDNSGNLKKIIETKNGFYFLKGREKLAARRRDLYRDANERWKKLRRVSTILQALPNVLMIAACNTLPINDFKPESDIDAFIIVKKNRVWITRFLVTVLVSLLGQWRHKKKIASKICLSFYLTDEALNLGPIAKKPYDVYLTHWIALVTPLYKNRESRIKHQGVLDIYDKFLQANNWIKEYLPNFFGYEAVEDERKVKEFWFLKIIKRSGEKILSGGFGDTLENFFRKIQKKKMTKNYQSAYYKNDSSVIISDQMLKFHEIDRREEFRRTFELKLAEIFERINCG